jgi:uncharacterized iron-regulated protein
MGRAARATTLVLIVAATAAAHAGGPLAGRIWSSEREAFVEARRVAEAAAQARYVLLGETHTSARHHLIQARLLDAASDARSPAVVVEMVPRDQQHAIDRWRGAAAVPSDFGRAVGWSERGWPDWSIYQPIVELAAARDLAIRAGGPERERFTQVAQQGLDALDPERRRTLRLDRDLPDTQRQRLARTLREAHCGETHAPIARMVALQRLRDAAMAERMRTATADGAVLIAGRGHTRRDFGVPTYLDNAADDAIAIALRGTEPSADAADGHQADDNTRTHDFVWFTADEPPRVPCPGESSEGGAD